MQSRGRIWFIKQIQEFAYKIIDEYEYVLPELITLLIIMSISSLRILQSPYIPKGLGVPLLSTSLTLLRGIEIKWYNFVSYLYGRKKILASSHMSPSPWSLAAEIEPSFVDPGAYTV